MPYKSAKELEAEIKTLKEAASAKDKQIKDMGKTIDKLSNVKPSKVATPAPTGLGLIVDGQRIDTVEQLNAYIHGLYYSSQMGNFQKA